MIAGICFVKHGNLSKSLIVLKVFWISTNAWDSSSMEWVMWWKIRFVSLLNVFKSSSVLQIMHWKGLNLTFLNFLNIFFWDSYCFKVCCFYFWRELGCVNWIKTSIPILPWADVEICQFCHSKPAQPARRNSLSFECKHLQVFKFFKRISSILFFSCLATGVHLTKVWICVFFFKYLGFLKSVLYNSSYNYRKEGV